MFGSRFLRQDIVSPSSFHDLTVGIKVHDVSTKIRSEISANGVHITLKNIAQPRGI